MSENSGLPFYKNKWFWVVIFIFIATSVAGANSLNIKSGNKAQSNEPVKVEQLAEEVNIKAVQPQQNEGFIKKQSFRDSDTYRQTLAAGKIFEADPSKRYGYKALVVLKNKDFGLQVDDYTAGFDITNIYAPCRLKVDVILDNPSEKTTYWSNNSFKAIDSQGYSYSPKIYDARGDSYGDIPPRGLRRCQLSFDIPPVKQNFTLVYTDADTSETINFILNIQARENERYQEQLAAAAKQREANKDKYAKQEEEQKQRELERRQEQEKIQQGMEQAKQWHLQQQQLQDQEAEKYAKKAQEISNQANQNNVKN